MLSWDEFDKEDGEVAAKGNTPAQAAAAATLDKLDSAGGAAALEARAATASDSEAVKRAKAALDALDVAEGLAELEGSSRCFELNHMLHRLCGPPSIPLSFNLATVLPRRNV